MHTPINCNRGNSYLYPVPKQNTMDFIAPSWFLPALLVLNLILLASALYFILKARRSSTLEKSLYTIISFAVPILGSALTIILFKGKVTA